MYRFALRGRWLLGLLGVLVAAAVCVRLGIWQLDRRDQRLAFNEKVESRGELPAAPLADLLAGGDATRVEYRHAVVEGRFDAERELLELARSYNGAPGMHVVTPLELADGRAVLVNRGFVPVTDPEAGVPEDAKPPAGTVEVIGVVRSDAAGGRFFASEPAVAAGGTLGHVTHVDTGLLGPHYPYDLLPVVVRVEVERPSKAGLPIPLTPPELGQGPHLSYAIQWFSFAAVFLAGWPVLVWRTGRRDPNRTDPRSNGHRKFRQAPVPVETPAP